MESQTLKQRNNSNVQIPIQSGGVENEAFEMSDQQDNSDSINENTINGLGKFTKSGASLRKKRKKAPEDSSPTATSKPLEFEDLVYDPNSANILARIIDGVRFTIYNVVVKNKKACKYIALALVFILCNAYFITAILYNRRNHIDWDWCDGHGLLIILFAITYFSLFYFQVVKRYYGKTIYNSVFKPIGQLFSQVLSNRFAMYITILAILGAIIAFIVIDAWESTKRKERLISASGVVVMVLLGLLFSKHPGRVQWRQVLGGMGVQFVFGLLVLKWEGGRNFLDCVSAKVTRFLDFSHDGSDFIYGFLSSGVLNVTTGGGENETTTSFSIGALFAFQALSVIYFFSFFVGLMYHIGAMGWVVMKVGWILQTLLGTTAAESMNASANIFLGQTEAPILIKPFLNDMTRSEIHAVMTGGFATIAGSVMAAYISFGVSASSLLTASVMAAPAALAFSKLLYPETQVSKTSSKDIKNMNTKSEGNALDAAAQGAAQGFVLIGNIIANIIAVISFVAFLNSLISWLGFLVGQEQLSFEWILGKIFVPVAICLGVDTDDTEDIALLLGLKTVVNEFVAYQKLLEFEKEKRITARSKRIAEYALCSFANFASVGIQLGGLSTLAPARRIDFSNVVWSALLAGTLTSLLNACVAGALVE